MQRFSCCACSKWLTIILSSTYCVPYTHYQTGKAHKPQSYLFIVLSLSLISSQCLSTVVSKTSTCLFKLSASSLCLSASKCQSDSHLNHRLLLSSHLFLKKAGLLGAIHTIDKQKRLWYLVWESDGEDTGKFPLGFSFCSLTSLWFSFLSSLISCLVWLIASHGLGVLGSPGMLEFIHGEDWSVPGILGANWALDSKCDGGTRSFWLLPK